MTTPKMCPRCRRMSMHYDSNRKVFRCYDPDCRDELKQDEHPDNPEVQIREGRANFSDTKN